MILEARIMNKNAEQTSTRGFILVRFRLIFFLDIHTTSNVTEVLLFSRCIMARCREHRQGETFKTRLPHKDPLQHNHRTKKKEIKKNYRKYGHVIYTALTHFLDLNYKHTSIFQLHISPTYSVPLDRYSLLLLKTQQCYEESTERRSDIQDGAVILVRPTFL